jgi:hypothetical protein
MWAPLAENEVVLVGSEDEANSESTRRRVIVQGVVFSRSVRSSFCTLHIVPIKTKPDNTDLTLTQLENADSSSDDDETEPMLIRVQFMNNLVALRSHFRRFFKHGDLVEVSESSALSSTSTIQWQHPDADSTTGYVNPRLVVHVENITHAASIVRVAQPYFWTIKVCQQWQRIHLKIPVPVNDKNAEQQNHQDLHGDICDSHTGCAPPPLWVEQPSADNVFVASTTDRHGAGMDKRRQAELVASFLMHMMVQKMLKGSQNDHADIQLPDPSLWADQLAMGKSRSVPIWMKDALAALNQGSGVLDVAGGSGHVSMCLGIWGVRSTVIDPRESVGKLPRRDRRLFQRALNQIAPSPPYELTVDGRNTGEDGELSLTAKDVTDDPSLYCHSVAVPFDSLRAWFGTPPVGVDATFRHPDRKDILILSIDCIATCSAIVALHPDEATDAIVDMAVKLRKPFVVVPCCVFHRFFPNRRKPNDPTEPVSSYQDLVEYLMAKDPSIQKAVLPFQGSNVILWSYF